LKLLIVTPLNVPFSIFIHAPANTKPDPTGPRLDVSKIDTSKLVWPEPPYIARIRWLNYFTGMPIDYTKVEKKDKKKQGWMDRLAGT